MGMMNLTTVHKLVDLNRRFYQDFGAAFAATRRRLQPGTLRVLASLPLAGDWLDLGCGSGQVARQLARMGFSGQYLGLDFSPQLLAEASRGWSQNPGGFAPRFLLTDLAAPAWADALPPMQFDVILCLAVMHHLPGAEARLGFTRRARALLKPGGAFIHSEWQFQHSPRLMARRQAWGMVGLRDEDLDEGDTLLDWRFALPGQLEQTGLRYVHLFTREELAALAQSSGFAVVESFESDGQGGKLALYQRWQAV